MRVLLDTCVFIWLMTEPSRLSQTASSIIQDPTNLVFASVVSLWEIEIKISKGKLGVIQDLKGLLDTDLAFSRLKLLDVERDHVHELPGLPRHHEDPFDRLLIAQAVHEKLDILTTDSKFASYPPKVRW